MAKTFIVAPRTGSLLLVGLFAAALTLSVSVFPAIRGPSPKTESIILGVPRIESSALVYVAESRGFFADEGLEATIKDYATGAASHSALLNGDVDVAIPAEYPLVGSAFKAEKVSAIASIDKVQYFYIVGRSDRGISRASDLRGKKIGVVRKTIAEFYLGRFLQLHGIDPARVTPVDIDISRSEDAMAGGDIDAIVTRPPYVSAIRKRLGGNALVWPAQSSQALYAIMVGRNDWLAERPEAVRRLLSSLVRAQACLIRHQAEAMAIVQGRLGYDDEYTAAVWPDNQFGLTLDQSLITALEDEARWMIANGLTTGKTVPDFLNYIHVDSLKALKPEAVNIIR